MKLRKNYVNLKAKIKTSNLQPTLVTLIDSFYFGTV